MFELMDAYSQSAVIKVIGVGGGGGNAVAHMVTAGIDGVEFMCINTDSQALKHAKVKTALQIGTNMTKGLGAGADPEVGRQAAMEDRDRIVEFDHLQHTAAAFCRGLINTLELAAEHRTGGNRRIDHVRNSRVDRELGRAVYLERRIEASDRLANKFELIRRPDGRLLVEFYLCGICGQRTVVETTAGGFVQNLAVGRLAFGRRHVPSLRRRGDQPLARTCAGL